MEQFSQSRGDDDLFNDEIVPIQPPPQSDLADQVRKLNLQKAEPSTDSAPRQSQHNEQSRGRGRGRGWKRGHGPVQIQQGAGAGTRGGGGGLGASRFAPSPIGSKQTEAPVQAAPQVREAQSPQTEIVQPSVNDHEAPNEATGSQEVPNEDVASDPPSVIPSDPGQVQTQPQVQKPPAVRGDRTATGGVRKPKLSASELSERLASAKAKSQSVAEKHARAQADAADFEERERVAQRKRREEEVDKRALEGEREKNRARKMQAQGGREWDIEKNEDDFRERRYGERVRRGGDGDQSQEQDMRVYEWREEGDIGSGRGRGRGRGRGEFRGNGRGRGRGQGRDETFPVRAPNVKAVDDFPALPGKIDAGPQQSRKESEAAGGSWADQMAN